LPNGIAAHDTLWRVLAALNPAQFQPCFVPWMSTVRQPISPEVIARAGKRLRRAYANHWRGLTTFVKVRTER